MTTSRSDKETLEEALRRLSHGERSAVTKAVLESAVDALPDTESQHIRDMAGKLSGSVKKLGPLTALEILAAIGKLWSDSHVTK